MGERTVVDTRALEAAARAVSRAARDVGGVGPAVRALGSLSGELSGARSGVEAAAVRDALAGALAELVRRLDDLGALLAAAAVRYADAEDAATVPAPPSGAAPGAASGPGSGAASGPGSGAASGPGSGAARGASGS